MRQVFKLLHNITLQAYVSYFKLTLLIIIQSIIMQGFLSYNHAH